jgi:hypothetical protein
MVKAYVGRHGLEVSPVEPDGGCLLTCVCKAEPQLGDARSILSCALAAVHGEAGQASLGESVPATIRAKARALLSRLGTRSRRIGALSDSDLGDSIPQALSRVSGRPLCICEGDARGGRVAVKVVAAARRGGRLPAVADALLRTRTAALTTTW